jgi:hypothetical protein
MESWPLGELTPYIIYSLLLILPIMKLNIKRREKKERE